MLCRLGLCDAARRSSSISSLPGRAAVPPHAYASARVGISSSRSGPAPLLFLLICVARVVPWADGRARVIGGFSLSGRRRRAPAAAALRSPLPSPGARGSFKTGIFLNATNQICGTTPQHNHMSSITQARNFSNADSHATGRVQLFTDTVAGLASTIAWSPRGGGGGGGGGGAWVVPKVLLTHGRWAVRARALVACERVAPVLALVGRWRRRRAPILLPLSCLRDGGVHVERLVGRHVGEASRQATAWSTADAAATRTQTSIGRAGQCGMRFVLLRAVTTGMWKCGDGGRDGFAAARQQAVAASYFSVCMHALSDTDHPRPRACDEGGRRRWRPHTPHTQTSHFSPPTKK